MLCCVHLHRRARASAERMKGESCSQECPSVFVNVINHRLADGDANCTCGNNMTQRKLLFTDFTWHFHQVCHEKARQEVFNKLHLKPRNCHHLRSIPIKHTHAYSTQAISSSVYYTSPHLKCYCTMRDFTALQTSDPQHLLHTQLHHGTFIHCTD